MKVEQSVMARQATIFDLDILVPLFDGYRVFYKKASDPDVARQFLRARFEHGESIIFVAEGAGGALGFTQLYPSFSSVSAARTFVLNDLFVSPEARRMGVGALLLRAAARFGREMGAVRLTLSTGVANVTAQALYEGEGWVRQEEFFVYNLAL